MIIRREIEQMTNIPLVITISSHINATLTIIIVIENRTRIIIFRGKGWKHIRKLTRRRNTRIRRTDHTWRNSNVKAKHTKQEDKQHTKNKKKNDN